MKEKSFNIVNYVATNEKKWYFYYISLYSLSFNYTKESNMKILVCMKQVPASSQVEIDPKTGAMKRLSSETRTNPYDLFALETAIQIREKLGGSVTVLTMGPNQAEPMMKDAFTMGADEAVILSDRKFVGSDVLATSYTLAQGIRAIGAADLIICGRQTTDGDTAQIGPAIAEHLGIAHTAWVSEICEVNDKEILVRQDLTLVSQISKMHYPCLLTVDKDICVPRLPSYLLKKKTKDRPVRILHFEDLFDQDLTRYGLIGSPTMVERMFPPALSEEQVYITGTSDEKAKQLYSKLLEKKII